MRFLLGNHDSYIPAYLHDPDWFDRTYHWLHDAMGGDATLASYGVPAPRWAEPAATRDAFAAAFPPEHLAFLDACELSPRSAATSSSTPASGPACRWRRRSATT